MRRALLTGLMLWCAVMLLALSIQASEPWHGDEPAGTYVGMADEVLVWDPDFHEEVTGVYASSPVLPFPDEIALTFFNRVFYSETEFEIHVDFNDERFVDLYSLTGRIEDRPPNHHMTWFSFTPPGFRISERSEPSFYFSLSPTFEGGYIRVRAQTIFNDDANDFMVAFDAEKWFYYEDDYGQQQSKMVSRQWGLLTRLTDGEYPEGVDPIDPDDDENGVTDPVDPIDTCEPVDVSGMIQVYVGITLTRGRNTYERNEDCATGVIRKNQPFTTGDTLYTCSDSGCILEISLGGGGEFTTFGGEPLIRLRPNSHFHIKPSESQATFRLSKGKMFFGDILSNIRSLYADDIVIETPSAATGIRGTELYITVLENGDTTVYVTHGEVEVTDLFDNTVTLLPGFKVSASVEGGLDGLTLISDADYADFEAFDFEEDSDWIWSVILVIILLSPIIVVFLVIRGIRRKIRKIRNK